MLAEAESALARVKIDGETSAGELQVASERLKQLKDMMPTQRLTVLVPSSGDHNDSRIFCSQGLQLRPSITGWHGKPPVPGEESTILLEGNNFSVHDTHVIAGGRSAKSVLISRHLLEVTIPKDATPTASADGTSLLNLKHRNAQRGLESHPDRDWSPRPAPHARIGKTAASTQNPLKSTTQPVSLLEKATPGLMSSINEPRPHSERPENRASPGRGRHVINASQPKPEAGTSSSLGIAR